MGFLPDPSVSRRQMSTAYMSNAELTHVINEFCCRSLTTCLASRAAARHVALGTLAEFLGAWQVAMRVAGLETGGAGA